MSVLEDMLREEHQRSLRMQKAVRQELAQLPRGYISRKMIRGRPVHYLQRREGKRVLSQYIRAEELEEIQRAVLRRKELQAMDKTLADNLRRIERALKS